MIPATLLDYARSFLFVPADRPDRYGKALASGADVVIIDLEDAIAPAGKLAARAMLAEGLAVMPAADRARILVRINGEGTPWFADDVVLAGNPRLHGLAGLMVPKVEGRELLSSLADACPGLALVPQIESGAGLDAMDDLARSLAVTRLCLGHLDLQNDLGIRCGSDESEIAAARWEIVRASRRANLPPPVDSVTAETQDISATERDAARAVRQGFAAKLCIHPAQVVAVQTAFMPSMQQMDWARRVLHAAAVSAGAACTVDGKMVDAPVITAARRCLGITG